MKCNVLMKNVSNITEDDLCIGCGACYASCPSNAITLKLKDIYRPSVNSDVCTNCGICLSVCPVLSWNKPQYSDVESLIGKHVDCYSGVAVDESIKYMGSSGGVITAILCYALDEGLIEGAIIPKLNGCLTSEVVIARTKQEIINSQGSKYFPVPMVSVLKDIINASGRFAFVGLPCHLSGLKQLESKYPYLKEKIVIKLGLFCGHGVDANGIKYVLNAFKIPVNSVTQISFRGYGWPGKMCIKYSSKNEDKIRFIKYQESAKLLFPSYYFMPKGCLFCPDHTAENSDLSFGDSWKLKLYGESGASIIILRNSTGASLLLNNAKIQNYVLIRKILPESVVYSQSEPLHYHKCSIHPRYLFDHSMLHRNLLAKPRPNFISYILALTISLNNFFYNKLVKANLFLILPPKLLRVCGLYISFLKFVALKKDFKRCFH